MDDVSLDARNAAIRELMEFSVPKQYLSDAAELLDTYQDDRIAVELLHEFYSYLPDAKDDWVQEIRLISRQKGLFLLLAMTSISGYVYLVSSEGIEFHGTIEEGIWDKELLDYFDIEDPKDLLQHNTAQDLFPLLDSLSCDTEICPACHASVGENHVFGCPVEICPWCAGQFVHCNCRFEKLGVETISTDDELVAVEQMLEDQGRIPYSSKQRPSFPEIR